MIIHDAKLVFVHIPRTAGTSITKLLKDYYDVNNVPEHFVAFQNDLIDRGYSPLFADKLLASSRHRQHVFDYMYGKHSGIDHYVKIYGEKRLSNYLKFTVVRNPWDRMVSWFMHLGNEFSDKEFMKWLKNKKNDNQLRCLRLGGEMWIDEILRYENLNDDLKRIFEKLEIDSDLLIKMPLINKTKRTKYQDYYGKKTRDRVAKIFAEEIKLFGYEY